MPPPIRIVPGKIQELQVVDENSTHYMVGYADNPLSVSRKEVPDTKNVGDTIPVFTFYNEQRELEATANLPEIQLNEVGAFKVKNVGEFGAFINIGTKRDILIPNREQREPLRNGEWCLVVLKCDDEHRRLFASTRLLAHMRNYELDYERGQEVELIIAEKMELGRRVVVNGRHLGVMFRNEILRPLRLGEKMKGYIREVKGKDITASMQKEGVELIDDASERIMEFLLSNKGYMRLTDDSDPEEIKLRLRMSKKTFKRAVGKLFKEGKVELKKFGVRLVGATDPEMAEADKKDETRNKRKKPATRPGK